MSRQAVRAGGGTQLNASPYITTAGTVNTSARVLNTHQGSVQSYARPLLIQNLDATNALYIKLGAADCSATDATIKLLANERILVDWCNIELLSLFMTAGAYTTAMVWGWLQP